MGSQYQWRTNGFRIHSVEDGAGKTGPDEEPKRDGQQSQDYQFGDQDSAYFGAREANYPESRQLAGPLRQRNARILIDDSEGDDDRESHVDFLDQTDAGRRRGAEIFPQ